MGQTVCFNTQTSQFNQNLSEIGKRTTDFERISLAVKVSKIFRHTLNSLTYLLHSLSAPPPLGVIRSISLGSSALKLFAIGLLPATLSKLNAGYLAEAQASINEKVDIYLGRIEAIGTLGEIFTKTVEGLTHIYTSIFASFGFQASTLNSMSSFVTTVTGPMSIVFAIFQGFGMVLTAKNLAETHRFSVIFNKSAALKKPVEDYAMEDYIAARKLIETNQTKEKSFVGKHFETSPKKLIARLHAIEAVAKQALSSANPQEVLDGKQKLQTTMQTLSNRLTSKKWSNALSLLASTIGNVGFGLLYSPCPPAGIALSAISCGMSIANFVHDKHKTGQFEMDLGIEWGEI